MTPKAHEIAACLIKNGAKDVLFVGGCVRDRILGIKPKDIDMEVYGLPFDEVVNALKNVSDNIKLVGESFGIIKVDEIYDVSIPRRENKVGKSHKDFKILCDPDMTPKEAAARRDFTINSMYMTLDGEIIDHYGGIQDLKNRMLRATSEAFSEDPLRVLRGMQFAGRFNMYPSEATTVDCRRMINEYSDLAKERIAEEWWKWATKSKKPSSGLWFLSDTDWIRIYEEIDKLIFCQQDPIYHPEGTVIYHSMHVCDAAATIADREQLSEFDRAVLLFAALCHDFGKVETTTKNEEGRWVSPAHDKAGVPLAEKFLKDIGQNQEVIDHVLPLVAEHMCHIGTDPTKRVVRRLANRLHPSNIKMWSHIVEADHSGRPPLPASNPVAHWVEVAKEVNVENDKPKPILMGRHLLECGVKAGPEMGKILQEAFELQLDGQISNLDEAIDWFKSR